MAETRAALIVEAKNQASGPMAEVASSAKATSQAVTDSSSANMAAANVADMLTGALARAASLGFAALTAAVIYSVNAAAESQKIMAQTEAVIKSTGGAAGLSAKQISDMATAFQENSVYSDEAVQHAENVLLTFKKVGAEVFPEATQAILDMSAALGTDLQAVTIQVGKALEDPVKGITALSRAGVSFTADQREMIKTLVETGDTLGAQRLILAELSSEFGGSAAAAAQTFSGRLEHLKNDADNLAESVGNRLLPMLTAAVEAADLLITASDKISAALKQNADRTEQTAQTYEQYLNSVLGAQVAAKALTAEQAEAYKATAFLATGTGDLTEEQVRARIVSGDLTEAEGIRLLAQQADIAAMQDAFHNLGILTGAQLAAIQTYDIETQRVSELAEMKRNKLIPAIDDEAAATQASKVAHELLADALRGTLGKATDGYLEQTKDTAVRTAELTLEIQKYQRMQGQTVTVVKEATATSADLDLAQYNATVSALKLAEAQQTLSENTDPDRQFELEGALLRARVAAENATEKVAALGGEMGSSTTYTLNYKTKIGELNAELEGLKAKADEAAQKVKDATDQFIYNKVAAGLDAEAALDLAHSLGLVDEESYQVSRAIAGLREQYDLNNDSQISAAEGAEEYGLKALALRDRIAELQQKLLDGQITQQEYETRLRDIAGAMDEAATSASNLKAGIDGLTDKTITVRTVYEYVQVGEEPGPPAPVVIPDTGGGGTTTQRAAGGQVSAGMPVVVGDAGRPELFVPRSSGYIFPFVPPAGRGGGQVLNISLGGITVNAGAVADPARLAQQIQVEIARALRANITSATRSIGR